MKNIYNKDIEAKLDLSDSLISTGNRHNIDLSILLLHLDYNPILSGINGIKERFWECAVIDILINNNDRNNGNWGVLKKGDSYEIAPVFDNGAAFFNKMELSKMQAAIADENAMKQKAMSVRTAYAMNDKPLFAMQLLSLNYPDLKNAILKITPVVKQHMPDILDMMNEIPEEYKEYQIINPVQKDYYKRMIEANYEYLIEPVYEKLR